MATKKRSKAKAPAAPHANARKRGEEPVPASAKWNGSGVAADQSRRGTKGHPIIEDVPQLGEWLIEQYCQSPRPTIAELRDRLQSTAFMQQLEDLGHKEGLSKTTVSDFLAEWKDNIVLWRAQAARKRVAIQNSRTYNDTDQDDELFEIDSAIATMTNVTILEELHLAVTEGNGIDEDLQEKLKLSVKLQNARTMRARVRFLINKGQRRIAAAIVAAIMPSLKEHPDLLSRVRLEVKKVIKAEEKRR